MGCDLLMAGGDKANLTLSQRVEKGNNGVAAQPENHFYVEPLQIVRQKIRSDAVAGLWLDLLYFNKMCGCAHDKTTSCSLKISLLQNSPNSSSSGGRSSGIGRLTQVTFM